MMSGCFMQSESAMQWAHVQQVNLLLVKVSDGMYEASLQVRSDCLWQVCSKLEFAGKTEALLNETFHINSFS